MNQGFSYYFKKGISVSRQTYQKKENYIKFYLLYLASLIGKLLLFWYPVCAASDVRMAKMAQKCRRLWIFNAYQSSNHGKQIGTGFLVFLIRAFLFLAGVVFFGGLTYLLLNLGYLLASAGLQDEKMIGLISLGVGLPGAILFLVFVLYFVLTFAGSSYILDTNGNLGASHVLYNSTEGFKQNGKRTLFCLALVFLLFHVAYFAATYGMMYGIIKGFPLFNLGLSEELLKVIAQVVGIAMMLGYLFVFPILVLAYRVSKFNLCQDIVSCELPKYDLEEFYEVETTPSVKKKKSAHQVKAQNKKDLLLSLFTNPEVSKGPSKLKAEELPKQPTETGFDLFEDQELPPAEPVEDTDPLSSKAPSSESMKTLEEEPSIEEQEERLEETPVEEPKEEIPAKEAVEEPKEETSAEETVEEPKEETSAEETVEEPKEEIPVGEPVEEEPKEENPDDTTSSSDSTLQDTQELSKAEEDLDKTNEADSTKTSVDEVPQEPNPTEETVPEPTPVKKPTTKPVKTASKTTGTKSTVSKTTTTKSTAKTTGSKSSSAKKEPSTTRLTKASSKSVTTTKTVKSKPTGTKSTVSKTTATKSTAKTTGNAKTSAGKKTTSGSTKTTKS